MSEDTRIPDDICPLTLAPIGQDLRLCQLCQGRRMARRLAELGLTPGVCLRVVQDAGGPLLVSVRNSRVALGRGIADKLTVEVLPESETRESEPAQETDAATVREGRGWRRRWFYPAWRRQEDGRHGGHGGHGRHGRRGEW